MFVVENRQVDQLVVTVALGEVEEHQKGEPNQDITTDVEGA